MGNVCTRKGCTVDDNLKQILKALSERTEKNTPFGYGVGTAADYLKHWNQCAGDTNCSARYSSELSSLGGNWESLLKQAEQQPVYSNDDMNILKTTGTPGSFKSMLKDKDTEIPPRTIMVVQLTVTTPQRDRDGDILRSEGAQMDLKQPFLWQHLHVAPMGKMLELVRQDESGVVINSAIIDSPLGNDGAQLIEFGALRISHGFLPKRFEKLEEEPEKGFPWQGFDFKEFEVMEHSGVSVPSNTGAVISAFQRGKLADPAVKSWAQQLDDARDKGITVGAEIHPDGSVALPGWKDASDNTTVTIMQEKGLTSVTFMSEEQDQEKEEHAETANTEGCSCRGEPTPEETSVEQLVKEIQLLAENSEHKAELWEVVRRLFDEEIRAEIEPPKESVEDLCKSVLLRLDSESDTAVIRRLGAVLLECAKAQDRMVAEKSLRDFLFGVTG